MAVLAGALVVAVLVVRNAVVEQYSERAPQIAARAWPGHPAVALNAGFAQIGHSAGLGQSPPETALAKVAEAARSAPLAVEPFLVRGVSAQVAGDLAAAERAFREAERRDPRSRAARYFLAEMYLRTGQTAEALREIAILSRLLPGTGDSLAPYLAQFAATPGAADELRKLFRGQPELRPALLRELAKQPGNADLVLSLASGDSSAGDQSWKTTLIDSLLKSGDFAKARQAWSRLSGVQSPGGLFDAEFRGSEALPPFNWSFAAGGGGLAEPTGGSLRVIYYGREQTVLASQLLTLRPGSYRLAMRVGGSLTHADNLAWRIICFPTNEPIAELGLGGAGDGGRLAAAFSVPAGCPAQRLELAGSPADVPAEVDLTVSGLSVTPAGRA